ncbi:MULTISPECIES: aspartyl-phosphate phosphatase Spo0E family protein [Rossellomorea]|uniref:Aspartyl-phosphate phosphatase Spo0E family protein n=1 Tax=Rossellomorea marisflavi TaxID=189381 RepID=A0A5D4RVW2_9BACI|nr:aspartyl-phosphate phosphatase Spo0E family protein [Rossellomorea marisflavi]MBV6683387.1 aspartyl-phosphate phosphatase Spo0E family protein [Bacillus sp. JRC01]VXB08701.1 Spo0A-P phosphatase [Bacillus sp. 349Y]MCM2588829.1 aspartyl-phosphate phosphatase Spo0E family protein [Rossellomorea marisflavi]MCM2604485.1 aspartyl-phosphate phosphatase Spo0E family protein [Rossellomorea marisflavi]MDR4937037.1 aspartyl-phosphate phosphatase Spo0E family protein [Rossellomorea marisflavi]
MSKKELLDRIELKRAQLIAIVAENGLTSPQAIQFSQELDRLLNRYNAQYIKNAVVLH